MEILQKPKNLLKGSKGLYKDEINDPKQRFYKKYLSPTRGQGSPQTLLSRGTRDIRVGVQILEKY